MARARQGVRGFSLFELVVVVVVVGLLMAVAISKFLRPMDSSRERVVQFQAAAFGRSLEHVRALSKVQNSAAVTLDNEVVIFVSRDGWALSTLQIPSEDRFRATQSGCQALWDAFFRRENTSVQPENARLETQFVASIVRPYVCRYTLVEGSDESRYFDYDVRTGSIVVQAS